MTCPALISLPPTRSGGPGGGLAAIQLGFAAEPVVDLLDRSAAPLYNECLARMMVARSVQLRGVDFIGDLEERGEIGLLDAAMVDLVLDALEADRHAVLGCNISPLTLGDSIAWQSVIDRIGARSWLAGRLTLEITESCPLDQIEMAPKRLAVAKRLGCRLAIDDFGAGFATVEHLLGVSIDWDVVKIDRRVLIAARGEFSIPVAEMVGIAAHLAPTIVVEGIETDEQLTAARRAGVRYGQGWMFEGSAGEHWVELDANLGSRLIPAFSSQKACTRQV